MSNERNDDFITLREALRDKFSSHRVNLPTSYRYKLAGKDLVLKLSENGLIGNMQDNSSAFESWSIILRHYLSDIIGTVTIDWDVPSNLGKGKLNYNRFLYRAKKFADTYDWVKLGNNDINIPSHLVCNCPNGPASDIDKHKHGSEGELECQYVKSHHSDYERIDHQFPVGIFDNSVSNNNRFATGGKSGIDIWGIKGDTFSLFELKRPDNKPLGILSEIMFYTNIINDLLSNRIKYEESDKLNNAIKHNYRSFGTFYKKAIVSHEIKRIHSILLASDFHPLINDGVIEFMNDSDFLRKSNINFSIERL